MNFTDFTPAQLRAINGQAIERLRAQSEALANDQRSGAGGNAAPGKAIGKAEGAGIDVLAFPSAKFSPKEIRAAWIRAKKSLSGG